MRSEDGATGAAAEVSVGSGANNVRPGVACAQVLRLGGAHGGLPAAEWPKCSAGRELAPPVHSRRVEGENIMTTNESSRKLTLGAMVEELVAGAGAMTTEGRAAAELAAQRLERVLVRGGNLRLAAALADLALELAAPSSASRRQRATRSFVAARAA
jgi:hypothetical protein